jgi:hypothetical protein
MGIQAFVPSGGGGTPGFDYIASIRMETYNRSWAQAGAAGNYILTSNNLSNGYAYFVGATTVGVPLGQVVNLTEPFTRIDIVGPEGDYISLQKAAVKSTSLFANPLAAFASFPSVIRSSGNFVLPNNALPLINLLIAGGGGGGGNGGHGGGGGGGGSVVKLTAYQAVGTTSIVIGGGGGGQGKGGLTYFGNVYAFGGGGGGGHNATAPTHDGVYGNGGGAGGWSNGTKAGATGIVMTSAQFGVKGSPVTHGGHSGGNAIHGGDVYGNRGGGGGGAAGAGEIANGDSSGGNGGDSHVDTTHGTGTISFGAGGQGRSHNNQASIGSHSGNQYSHGGAGEGSNHGGPGGGDSGAVIVRYYIP